MPRGPSQVRTWQERPKNSRRYAPYSADRRNAGSDVGIPQTLRDQERETDPMKLKARQKQIDIGKNTIGYSTYIQEVPKHKRTRTDPATPNKYQICSKRSWDGQIRKWRKQLHAYDPPAQEGEIVINPDEYEDPDVTDENEIDIESVTPESASPNTQSTSTQPKERTIYDDFEDEVDVCS